MSCVTTQRIALFTCILVRAESGAEFGIVEVMDLGGGLITFSGAQDGLIQMTTGLLAFDTAQGIFFFSFEEIAAGIWEFHCDIHSQLEQGTRSHLEAKQCIALSRKRD